MRNLALTLWQHEQGSEAERLYQEAKQRYTDANEDRSNSSTAKNMVHISPHCDAAKLSISFVLLQDDMVQHLEKTIASVQSNKKPRDTDGKVAEGTAVAYSGS